MPRPHIHRDADDDDDAVTRWADVLADEVDAMLSRADAAIEHARQVLANVVERWVHLEQTRAAAAKQRWFAASRRRIRALIPRSPPCRRALRRQAWAVSRHDDGIVQMRVIRASRTWAIAANTDLKSGHPLPDADVARLQSHYAGLLAAGATPQQAAAHERRMSAFATRTRTGKPSRRDLALARQLRAAAAGDRLQQRDLDAQRAATDATTPRKPSPATTATLTFTACRQRFADAVATAFHGIPPSSLPCLDPSSTDAMNAWDALAQAGCLPRPHPSAAMTTRDASSHRDRMPDRDAAIIVTNGAVDVADEPACLGHLMRDLPAGLRRNARPIAENIVTIPDDVSAVLREQHDEPAAIHALGWWLRARAAAIGLSEAAAISYGHLDRDHLHAHELRSRYLPDGSHIMTGRADALNSCIDAALGALLGLQADLDPPGHGGPAAWIYAALGSGAPAAGRSPVWRVTPSGQQMDVDMSPGAVAARILADAGQPPAILREIGMAACWAKPSWATSDLQWAHRHNAKRHAA